jgi:hypothetical protein
MQDYRPEEDTAAEAEDEEVSPFRALSCLMIHLFPDAAYVIR